MSKAEIIAIIEEQVKSGKWCNEESLKAIEAVSECTDILDLINTIPSEWAFYWGLYIGDREVMRDRVVDSRWAYCWGMDIGDREVMRDRVVDSKWAYKWGYYIGDRKIMRDRVVDSEWAKLWEINVENKNS